MSHPRRTVVPGYEDDDATHPRLPLRRVRVDHREVGRPLRRVPGLGTVAETGAPTAARTTAAPVITPAQRIADVDLTRAAARPTGVAEFDRVLGGGLVPGGVVLVAG